MLIVRNTTQASTILNTMSTLGVNPPRAVAEAHDLAKRMLSQSDRLLNVAQGSLAVAVANALEAGVDPASDKEVQRLVTAAAISNQGVSQGVEGFVSDKLAAVFTAHADAVVKALSKPFDAAAGKLLDAHNVLGSVNLADTAGVLARGGAAPAAWADATQAAGTIDSIRSAWVALATLVRRPPEPHFFILQIADVDPQTWIDLGLTERKMRPWEIVCEGISNLSLPTLDEYRRRVASIATGRAQRDQQNIEAGKAYNGRRVLTAAPNA